MWQPILEVSVHQGSVEAMSAISDAGQAPTMDNLVPAPQCATLLTSAHVPSLGSTSNTLLLAHRTCAAEPFLVTGPSFLRGMHAPISMLPGTPIVFSGMPGAQPAPYSTMQSDRPNTALQPVAGMTGPRLVLVQLRPLQLGQCICLLHA